VRGQTRLAVAGLLLVAGSITSERSSTVPQEQPGLLTFASGPSRGLTSPIAADAVTLEEARARAPYPIPLLPGLPLGEVCDEGGGTLRLLQAWANYAGSDPKHHQTALTYNHGVYLQLEPITAFTFGDVSELPPLEKAFAPDDYPIGLLTSTVRNHTAWVAELKTPVTCPGPAETVWYTPGPGCPNDMCTIAPPPQVQGAFMFSPMETAVLKWLERGVVMELVGPYPSETLKTVAEGILWPAR
jgi:hypothetical protein